MPVKRRIRRGFATNVLCVLKHEGAAPVGWLARRFGHSETAGQRLMDSLERQGLVRLSTVMHPGGKYYLTDRGWIATGRGAACRRSIQPGHPPVHYVPMRGARRKRRR